MLYITYFVHGTTTDNEHDLCMGWAPGQLSELGKRQAKDLGEQVDASQFAVMFCSDLQRAVDSAELGFGGMLKIIQDQRLRECNYGDLTQRSEDLVDYAKHIAEPFPNGESLHDVEQRMREFLEMLNTGYADKHVALMAHKAPQLALEVLLNGKTWEQAITEDWRKKKAWQPGWSYLF
ncbi:MAG: histidine phosphatase family protein [Candidatus Nomurabacteria bacterium]|nr:MAG: histidine phosphatase family protein [Candidatus Nomurabacteria bacterium]